MENEELIRREHEETRALLTEKLEALENEGLEAAPESTSAATEAAERVAEAARDIMQSVGDVTRKHPLYGGNAIGAVVEDLEGNGRSQLEEIMAGMAKLETSIEGIRHDNAELRRELASFKELAANVMADRTETELPQKRSLYWAFLNGVGSVLEIYPPEGCFDRWRLEETIPENEHALLFRELWEGAHPKMPSDGAKA